MHNMKMPPPEADHESAGKFTAEAAPLGPDAGASGEPAMDVESVQIRKAANGGFIVTCNKSSPKRGNSVGDYSSKDYAFMDLGEAMSFVQTEFGGGAPAPDMAAAPAPAMGAGPAAAPMPPAGEELI